MHHVDWEMLASIWTWATLLTSWPFAYWMGKPKALTDEQRWEIFREMASRPQLMADGISMQRIEWKYVPYVAPVSETSTGVRPATIVQGARPVPQ